MRRTGTTEDSRIFFFLYWHQLQSRKVVQCQPSVWKQKSAAPTKTNIGFQTSFGCESFQGDVWKKAICSLLNQHILDGFSRQRRNFPQPQWKPDETCISLPRNRSTMLKSDYQSRHTAETFKSFLPILCLCVLMHWDYKRLSDCNQ